MSLPSLSFFDDLSKLKSRIAAIEKWKDGTAIPTIDINTTNAESALNKTGLNKEVITAIIDDIKNQLKPTIDSAIARINDAKAFAQGALDSAKEIVATMEKSADGLKKDGDLVKTMSSRMINTIKTETNNIKSAFQDFGTTIYNAAAVIVTKTQGVASELKEAVEEIKPALNASIAEANAATRYLSGFPKRPIPAARSIIRSILFLTLRGAGGQGSVLAELSEGFREINLAFTQLSTAFGGFGNAMKKAPTELGADINNSVNAITAGVSNFGNSFGTLTDGLAARFKGLMPPAPAKVVKAVYVKTPTELEAERIRQQQVARQKQLAMLRARRYEQPSGPARTTATIPRGRGGPTPAQIAEMRKRQEAARRRRSGVQR